MSPQKKNADEDSYMRKIHFFDGTEGLDLSQDVRMLLNSKLDKMYGIYNEKLLNLS